MKNNLFKIYLLGFFILTDFMMFAQPGDDTIDGDLESNDDPPVPISGKMIYLGIAGLLFAIYTYKRHKKLAQQ